MKFPNLMSKPSVSLLVIINITISANLSIAQTSDLTDPKLNANMTLPQNNPPGTPIPQMLTKGRQLAISKGVPWSGLRVSVSSHEVLPTTPLNTALLQLYQRQTCQADAIVVGHVTSSTYHLSAAETAIYGDYDLKIDALWKDDRASSINSRQSIIVTRPGGSLSLPDGSVHFEIDTFPLLQPGATYVQFLRFIPQSSAYQAIDQFSTLTANGNNWMIAHKTYAELLLLGFTRRELEATVKLWLTSCQ